MARQKFVRGTLAGRQRLIFLHIPKCAGSSLTSYFRPRLGTAGSGRFKYLFDWRMREDWHDQVAQARQATFVTGHFGADALDEIRKESFSCTFLREPRSRLRSHFKYFSTAEDEAEDHVPTKDYLTFLTSDLPVCLRGADNVIARQLAVAYDIDRAARVPRAAWLDRAQRTLESLDFVGFQESFDADFAALLERLHLRPPPAPPRTNVTEDMRSKAERHELVITQEVLEAEDRCLTLDLELYAFARVRAERP